MRFETGKKKGTTIFQAGKYAWHMLTFFTDSRLDMLISVMLIKKTYYFCNKISIIDVQLGYIQTSKNIEIFNVKLRWSKSSRLLQRVAFLVLI